MKKITTSVISLVVLLLAAGCSTNDVAGEIAEMSEAAAEKVGEVTARVAEADSMDDLASLQAEVTDVQSDFGSRVFDLVDSRGEQDMESINKATEKFYVSTERFYEAYQARYEELEAVE